MTTMDGLNATSSTPSNRFNPHLTDGERVEQNSVQTAELLELLNENLTSETKKETTENAEPEQNNAGSPKLINRNLIWTYLNACYGGAEIQPQLPGTATDGFQPLNPVSITFKPGCEWINVTEPPNLEVESLDKVIILEFFTHCCINCIHSIEDVKQVHQHLSKKFQIESTRKCGIRIISVHSPKFTREKENDSVLAFVKRNRMTHTDVVNDPTNSLWNHFSIFCWPTLLIFAPSQLNSKPFKLNLLFTLIGEGHKDELQILLENTLEYFNSKIDFSRLSELAPLHNAAMYLQAQDGGASTQPLALQFPGKVSLYNDILVISDTGNNRIIVCNTEGHVKDLIGGIQSGYVNGDFTTARFYNPQGTAFRDENVFYVADTGNHAVRQVNLITKQVSTLVEPNSSTLGNNESVINLKSPWDLAIYDEGLLLIAGAGNHQIFGYTFTSITLFGTTHLSSSFVWIAGTGKEENRNNMYIRKASFAQPSGICVSQILNENDKVIYVADSESSTIRLINPTGRVMPFVGGNKDPTDLFAYGDIDGCSYDVRLQHPMGVCSASESAKVFIADTYNHKIKMIDFETKHCTTIIGDGTAGDVNGSFSGCVTPKKRSNPSSQNSSTKTEMPVQLARLNEPSGISIDPNQTAIYIADTNNHTIKVCTLKDRTVHTLEMSLVPESQTVTDAPSAPSQQDKFNQDYYIEMPVNCNTFSIRLLIHDLSQAIEGGEWRLLSIGEKNPLTSGRLTQADGQGVVQMENLSPENNDLLCQVDIYFCGSNSCVRRTLKFHLVIISSPAAAQNHDQHQSVELDFYPSVSLFKDK